MNNNLNSCKLFLPVLIILSLCCRQFSWADEVSGIVVNGTYGEKSVANIPVLLQKIGAMDTIHVDVGETYTDRNGKFQFNTQFTDTTASYFAAVDYQGAHYYSSSNDPMQQRIVVFDSTHNTSRINIVMHHVIIGQMGDRLKIKETCVIQNPDSLAIPCSGVKDTKDQPVIYFTLPEGYLNVRQSSMTFGNTLVTGGNNLFFLGVIHPGNNPVTYTYELPFKRRFVGIDLLITHFTQSLDIFSSDPVLKITSAQLHDEGPFTIRGNQYQRFNARELASGTVISYSVTHSVNNRPRFLVLALLAVAVALFSVVNFIFRRSRRRGRKPVTDPVARLKTRRQELVDAIARIDAQEGSQSKQSQAKRQQLFAELQEIEMSLQEHKDEQE